MLEDLSHGQKERLAFIDFSLQYFGHVSRNDLINRFKTGLAASTRDFATYKQLASNNLELVHQTKYYYRTKQFSPVFSHDPEAILTGLCRGFGNGISNGIQPSEQCLDAVRLIHPDANIIAALMRAIHNRKAIECEYVSLSSGPGERQIVPHALVNNGHRWHVRAYDRKHQAFRDFVCTRFSRMSLLESDITQQEAGEEDKHWLQLVTLELVPHPALPYPQGIEMDYNMSEGKLTLQVRAALASYLLRQWQVDCSSQHRLKGCQLALKNLGVLTELDNIAIAPGA